MKCISVGRWCVYIGMHAYVFMLCGRFCESVCFWRCLHAYVGPIQARVCSISGGECAGGVRVFTCVHIGFMCAEV